MISTDLKNKKVTPSRATILFLSGKFLDMKFAAVKKLSASPIKSMRSNVKRSGIIKKICNTAHHILIANIE